MATRKRARDDEGQFLPDNLETDAVNEAYEQAPHQPATVDTLAAFIGAKKPDKVKLGKALDLAKESAEAFTGAPVPEQMGHALRQGVQLLASQLLIKGHLEAAPKLDEIPLVVRYYWRVAGAGR